MTTTGSAIKLVCLVRGGGDGSSGGVAYNEEFKLRSKHHPVFVVCVHIATYSCIYARARALTHIHVLKDIHPLVYRSF